MECWFTLSTRGDGFVHFAVSRAFFLRFTKFSRVHFFFKVFTFHVFFFFFSWARGHFSLFTGFSRVHALFSRVHALFSRVHAPFSLVHEDHNFFSISIFSFQCRQDLVIGNWIIIIFWKNKFRLDILCRLFENINFNGLKKYIYIHIFFTSGGNLSFNYERTRKFENFSLSWAELTLTYEKFRWAELSGAELDQIKFFLSWARPYLKNPELSSSAHLAQLTYLSWYFWAFITIIANLTRV